MRTDRTPMSPAAVGRIVDATVRRLMQAAQVADGSDAMELKLLNANEELLCGSMGDFASDPEFLNRFVPKATSIGHGNRIAYLFDQSRIVFINDGATKAQVETLTRSCWAVLI